MSFSVVKASLNQFCKNDFLKSKLNDIVVNVKDTLLKVKYAV